LVFSANSQLISDYNILDYSGEKIDLEGVLYKSPESRESGSRLYLDTDYIIREGAVAPASGKVIIYSSENTKSLAYGDRVRLLGIKLRPIENFKNPGGFNLKKFYERQNIYARGFIDGEDSIISFGLSKSYSPVLYSIDRLRIKFGNFVRSKFPSPESEILNAITIGEKGGIPAEIRTEFSKSGVAHILAISGIHVGAVAFAFFFLIKWLLKRSEYILLRWQVPRLAAGMTIVPIFLYAAIAGFSTTTVRAFIMISIYLLSIVIGKEEYRINTFSAAALIILLWHPWSLFELSFQLSFTAVFGILLAHKFYPFKFTTLEDKFYSLVKTAAAATLVTFPLVANSFGILPLVSIPANLILVPLVEIIVVPLSLVSFLVFLISPYIAGFLISLNIFFIEILMFGVETLLKIPYSSLIIPPLNTLSWILFFIIIISPILNSAYPRVKFVIPFAVIGLILSLINPIPGKGVKGVLEVNILDVGEKKSLVFIQLPDKKNGLIDGGYSNTDGDGYLERTVITNYLLSTGIREIDFYS
jgi:competence protein ComEC